MLTDLVVGEHVILDLKYDLDPVVGVFDGISKETGFVKVLSKRENGGESISFVNPRFIKEPLRILLH
ncbi:hypothetical protein P4H32_32375 [Bacillus cereus]|nr:hypothetical protein [Bacillus cereus]